LLIIGHQEAWLRATVERARTAAVATGRFGTSCPAWNPFKVATS